MTKESRAMRVLLKLGAGFLVVSGVVGAAAILLQRDLSAPAGLSLAFSAFLTFAGVRLWDFANVVYPASGNVSATRAADDRYEDGPSSA